MLVCHPVRRMNTLLAIIGTVMWIGNLKEAAAELQNPATALERTTASLTLVLPDTVQVTSNLVIRLGLTKPDQEDPQDVLYIFTSDFSVRLSDKYEDRFTVKPDLSQRRLNLELESVTANDTGTYQCYEGGTQNKISDCGQMLIIIRKPDPPTIVLEPSSSLLEGTDLVLECETRSTSLPAGHSLPSEIWWTNENGDPVGIPGGSPRIRVNSRSQLVVESLERSDKGLKFRCQSADNAGDVSKRLRSELSVVYTVVPEYAPNRKDLRLTPDFENDAHIRKKIAETVRFECEAECNPDCDITWLYQPMNETTGFGEVPGLANKNILDLRANRVNEGTYRCKAKNKHGIARQNFHLEVLYMTAPVISINGRETSTARVVEGEEIKLKCEFDANPGPRVVWSSPFGDILLEELAKSSSASVENNGINKRMFVSSTTLDSDRCEDTGRYQCQGQNGADTKTGNMDLTIMCCDGEQRKKGTNCTTVKHSCPPSSAGIPGQELKSEYVWEIPHALSFKFVIRAVPQPAITRIDSVLNGRPRNERISSDIDVRTENGHSGKPYLTQFTVTTRRRLDQSDAGRVYTMTIWSTEFNSKFDFTIQPRGPPHEVQNLTAVEIKYSSLMLFWLPGFNGGQEQTFTVDFRQFDENNVQGESEGAWTVSRQNIPDKFPNWVEIEVTSLRPSTQYIIRVSAFNELGNSSSEIEIKTAAAPDTGIAAGAIVGIIFGLLVLIAVILFLLYIFVYKKRWGKDKADGGRKLKLPEQLTALFSKKEKQNQNGPNDGDVDDEVPKNGPIYKLKKRFNRKPDNPSPTYQNVPMKDASDDDFVADDVDDGDYVNTNVRAMPDNENIYANEPALNNNAESSKQPESTGTRQTNEDGLIYLSLDFPGGKKGGKAGKAPQEMKEKDKKAPAEKKGRVDYSDIDFSKTAEVRKEQEAARKREEEAAAEAAKKEEEKTAGDKDAGDAAKDGGADVDGDGDTTRRNQIPEQGFGTTV